jgi:hypothetical protein
VIPHYCYILNQFKLEVWPKFNFFLKLLVYKIQKILYIETDNTVRLKKRNTIKKERINLKKYL